MTLFLPVVAILARILINIVKTQLNGTMILVRDDDNLP